MEIENGNRKQGNWNTERWTLDIGNLKPEAEDRKLEANNLVFDIEKWNMKNGKWKSVEQIEKDRNLKHGTTETNGQQRD